METEKLNSLVEMYRNGDDEALNELCRLFLPVIQRHSDEIWYFIENQTDFECRCLLKIKQALSRFRPNKGSVYSLILSVIQREKKDFLSRRKRKINAFSLDEPLKQSDGSEIYLEVPDVLADVENKIIEDEKIKEMVALLAKGDRRREMILKAWMEGEYNDSRLAKELAAAFPGIKESGHRRAIQRFEKECRELLAPTF